MSVNGCAITSILSDSKFSGQSL